MEESDYRTVIRDMFICVWEAEEPFEFILSDNAFGIFKGNSGPRSLVVWRIITFIRFLPVVFWFTHE
jgi:hypothetical protein